MGDETEEESKIRKTKEDYRNSTVAYINEAITLKK